MDRNDDGVMSRRIIWYDDHFNEYDEVLIEELVDLVVSKSVAIEKVRSQKEFSACLKKHSAKPNAVSGLLLDLMLTTGQGEGTWSHLGFDDVNIDPYNAGKQVLEFLVLEEYKAVAPTFITAFSNHKIALLTSAEEETVFDRIPMDMRLHFPLIFKNEIDSDSDVESKFIEWLEELPVIRY